MRFTGASEGEPWGWNDEALAEDIGVSVMDEASLAEQAQRGMDDPSAEEENEDPDWCGGCERPRPECLCDRHAAEDYDRGE